MTTIEVLRTLLIHFYRKAGAKNPEEIVDYYIRNAENIKSITPPQIELQEIPETTPDSA